MLPLLLYVHHNSLKGVCRAIAWRTCCYQFRAHRYSKWATLFTLPALCVSSCLPLFLISLPLLEYLQTEPGFDCFEPLSE